jgi:membrane protein required for colicin V production
VNPADIFVIVVVLLSAIIGLVRGFLREVLSIASWLGAALFAWWTLDWGTNIVRETIGAYVQHDLAHKIIAGAALFLVALIVLAIVSHYIAKLVVGGMLGAIDRSVGFVFGVARGLVLVALALIGTRALLPPPAANATPTPPWTWIDEARSRPLVEQVAEFLHALAPPEFRRDRQASDDRGPTFRQAIDALRTPGAAARARDDSAGTPRPAGDPIGRIIDNNPAPQR